MKYAVLQPYFFPYGGYYQLLAAVDTFVIFDNAQHPRRGRVHRLQARNRSGSVTWLTLPLNRAPQETQIREITINLQVWRDFLDHMQGFPNVVAAFRKLPGLGESVKSPNFLLIDFLTRQLTLVRDLAGLDCVLVRASEILPREGKGYQDYITELGARIGGHVYVNPSGGRNLYDPAFFSARGISLAFMDEYQGNGTSILDQSDPLEWSGLR